MARVEHRLFLVDVDRGHPRAPALQGGDQRAGLDRRRSAGVTSSAVGFMRARSPAVTISRVASTSRSEARARLPAERVTDPDLPRPRLESGDLLRQLTHRREH
jgi:hypothetical protein